MVHRETSSSGQGTVQINLEGKTYTGSYTVDAEMITVSYGGMSTMAHLGDFASHPIGLARLLLEEMVKGE